MNVLAIDTSHRIGSVALVTEAGVSAHVDFGAESSHLAELGGCARELLAKQGIAVGDIDRVAVVSGPGSFTGLRIGLAFAKGMYAARRIDVVTMTSLELLARQSGARGQVCAMIDARRGEVYAAAYDFAEAGAGNVAKPREILSACAASPTDILPRISGAVTFTGTGTETYRDVIAASSGCDATFSDSALQRPSTAFLADVARVLTPLSEEQFVALEPFYIRPSDARRQKLRRIEIND